MRHLDLFSGIGGFALAASWVWGEEHEIHSFVEIDLFCQKVLKKHWPDVPIHSNIKDYEHDGTTIDLLTGGWPCQPFSSIGNKQGTADTRHLWPEMFEIIKTVRPTWVIGENVPGIINMALDAVCFDLESSSYSCQSFNLPACSVDAWHRRHRIILVAHTEGDRIQKGESQLVTQINRKNTWGDAPKEWGMVYGLPDGVDRLKSLGNAIVPQMVVPIMEAIKTINANNAV